MANQSAHRLPDSHHHHHHHHRLTPQANGSPVVPSASSTSSIQLQQLASSDAIHQQSKSQGGANFRGHQRRQSVARLLPDISKLRLLSWLVEASSELINCDIAIMDGVYAKLNRSRESLLFWDSGSQQQQQQQQRISTALSQQQNQRLLSRPPPPPPPSGQPVANKIVISQQQRRKSSHSSRQASSRSPRNHHSLPITNFDASSLAAVSMSQSPSSLKAQRSATARSSRSASRGTAAALIEQNNNIRSPTSSLLASSFANAAASQQQQPLAASGVCLPERLASSGQAAGGLCDDGDQQPPQQNNDTSNQPADDSCDSQQSDDEDEDDDSSSSAASSTTSSGIHGGGTSLSSAASSSSSSSAGESTGSAGDLTAQSTGNYGPEAMVLGSAASASIQGAAAAQQVMSSAELLSEKIRLTVMKHNYLQSLLVNIIRQHDKQRDQMNQQRRRQMSIDQFNMNRLLINQQQQRIDLAEIADALDDGCLCMCHSTSTRDIRCANMLTAAATGSTSSDRASTLPASTGSSQQQQPPARKARRPKKSAGTTSGRNNSADMDRQDIINLMADKLCENCFETHYWLHGCSMDLIHPPSKRATVATSGNSNNQTRANNSNQDSSAIIAKRNATFIKLVQQEVRSTISKSIELIDLIRKEIKLPESIKQKQLMRCFSTSIQLLTSVGNYVVPAQDISSFIPEVLGQQETTLFSLPPSDFDHLILYPMIQNHGHHQHYPQQHQPNSQRNNPNHSHHHHNQHQQPNSNYHLAQAPEIPMRRRHKTAEGCSGGGSLKSASKNRPVDDSSNISNNNKTTVDQALSSTLQRLKTSDDNKSDKQQLPTTNNDPNGSVKNQTIGSTAPGAQDSSSGASSNNSSASSSIARGAVQQSSLTRAQTSSAILDGKTSHDLSFEAIANLSRQQTEDDLLFQSRPKFWQSSKFNFIKKLLHVKQQRLLRQQSKDRRIYNNKVQNKFRLVMMDLTHFNKSQQLLTTENGVNSLLTSMRNVLEFGLYLTLKLY